MQAMPSRHTRPARPWCPLSERPPLACVRRTSLPVSLRDLPPFHQLPVQAHRYTSWHAQQHLCYAPPPATRLTSYPTPPASPLLLFPC